MLIAICKYCKGSIDSYSTNKYKTYSCSKCGKDLELHDTWLIVLPQTYEISFDTFEACEKCNGAGYLVFDGHNWIPFMDLPEIKRIFATPTACIRCKGLGYKK
jgi:hypothetical protein